MAPRPYWKGYLKLSLVSCPIALYPATSGSERVSFRQVNKETGNRLKQKLVDAETGQEVDSANKGRGYEIGKNQFILVEDDELEKIRVESSHTIDIDSFVPRDQIDQRYLDTPYYIIPNDTVGQEAFAVIREAMRDKKMVALGHVVLAKRERVIMLEARGKGLLATTLHYPYEIRKESEYFDDLPDIKLPDEMTKLASHILESKRADFEPEKFEDRYETALVKLLRAKQAGLPERAPESTPEPARVINLMDALKRSIADAKGSKPTERRRPPAPSKAGRRGSPKTRKAG